MSSVRTTIERRERKINKEKGMSCGDYRHLFSLKKLLYQQKMHSAPLIPSPLFQYHCFPITTLPLTTIFIEK
jgi:hypothetical protein